MTAKTNPPNAPTGPAVTVLAEPLTGTRRQISETIAGLAPGTLIATRYLNTIAGGPTPWAVKEALRVAQREGAVAHTGTGTYTRLPADPLPAETELLAAVAARTVTWVNADGSPAAGPAVTRGELDLDPAEVRRVLVSENLPLLQASQILGVSMYRLRNTARSLNIPVRTRGQRGPVRKGNYRTHKGDEAMALALEGMSTRDIAARHKVSATTVRTTLNTLAERAARTGPAAA